MTLNLCTGKSSYHEEVCYEGSTCPTCQAADDRDVAVSKVEELQDRIKELEVQL